MTPIVQIKFGSHLYGTATEASDLDIKGVYLPSARAILLQDIQPLISEKRQKAHGEKNTPEDVDYELYSPQKYLSLLAEGQTVALDMLFAPDSAMLKQPDERWRAIQVLAPKILTKQAASFVRYCRQQANKYGIKGSRVAAARLALEVLSQAESRYGTPTKLSMAAEDINKAIQNNEFLTIGEDMLATGEKAGYFEICGKKALLNASIKSARTIAQKLMDEYGERALAAERNEGIDWKALSHAVRVGREALEFLESHHITFPRPEAHHLLAIKLGRLPFQQVSEEIEQLVVEVEDAAMCSTLPESYNRQVVEDFIEQLHREQVMQAAI